MKTIKSISNNASKLELFSKKQVLNAVKNSFDADTAEENTRAYILQIGYTADEFKNLTWQDLDAYIIVKNKQGFCSTWAMHNALRKYADTNKLPEKRAAEKAAAEEAAKLAEAAEKLKEQERKELRNAARREQRAKAKAEQKKAA